VFRLRVQEKGLSLAFKIGADVPQFICSDQSKLRQILINLLGNAVKFTKNGRITLRVKIRERFQRRQTQICAICFEVSDTGIGISPEEKKHIFDAFFQSDAQPSYREGTGLGLSISQRFAEMMGSGLMVDSEAGKGTTFSFDVQAGVSQYIETISSHFKRRVIGLAAGQPTFRLLVVDDDENSRDLMVTLFRSVGFDVAEAVNGQEALETWEKWHPDLIWMDIRMPVTDGYEAISMIKSKMRKSAFEINTKIIALTASAFEEDRIKVMEQGADDFVRKPFSESDIFQTMERHLGVQYIYSEGYSTLDTVRSDVDKDDVNLTDSVGNLPDNLIAMLEEAVELSDSAMIDDVIESIRTKDALLAEALSKLAGNFAHERILDLIQKQ
jgi:CheY-like chemotaxis protein